MSNLVGVKANGKPGGKLYLRCVKDDKGIVPVAYEPSRDAVLEPGELLISVHVLYSLLEREG